jgi:hypothetical protein
LAFVIRDKIEKGHQK